MSIPIFIGDASTKTELVCEDHGCQSPGNHDVRLVHFRIPMKVNRWYDEPIALCKACRVNHRFNFRYSRE